MADLLFLVHVFLGLVLVWLWQFKSFYLLYLVILIATLASNLFFKDCFLAQWEFYFRKKLRPELTYTTFFDFYFHQFFGLRLNLQKAHNALLVILWLIVGLNAIYWILMYV